MKNSRLKELMTNSKLPKTTADMISLDAELIKSIRGGGVEGDAGKNKGCTINNGTCGGNQ